MLGPKRVFVALPWMPLTQQPKKIIELLIRMDMHIHFQVNFFEGFSIFNIPKLKILVVQLFEVFNYLDN